MKHEQGIGLSSAFLHALIKFNKFPAELSGIQLNTVFRFIFNPIGKFFIQSFKLFVHIFHRCLISFSHLANNKFRQSVSIVILINSKQPIIYGFYLDCFQQLVQAIIPPTKSILLTSKL